jgi:hypothetical protein
MGGADPARAVEERPDALGLRTTGDGGFSASEGQDPDET